MDFRREPFNFSRLCNQAAAKTLAPLLLFLNDDTRAIHPDWLSVLAGYFSDPKIGVIGPILLYPDNTIQHAGIVMGMHGLAGHILQGAHETETHYNGLPRVSRNVAAVTGACLLTRRDIFLAVGGFNEVDLPVSFQDVDYCLKVWEQGLRVVLTPHVRLYHLESASRGRLPEAGFDHSVAWMKARWARWIEDDPFYNPHLSRTMTCFDLGT
jgi:GT2 family glycosyltransferase